MFKKKKRKVLSAQEPQLIVYLFYLHFPTAISSNIGVEVTIIWLFVTVTAGLRPNANVSKSIHWQFNYTVCAEKEKRNIRFLFPRSAVWTVGEFDSVVARNMWEQFTRSVTEQNIGRIHFGGACQLAVNVKLTIPLLNVLWMPRGSQRCNTKCQLTVRFCSPLC